MRTHSNITGIEWPHLILLYLLIQSWWHASCKMAHKAKNISCFIWYLPWVDKLTKAALGYKKPSSCIELSKSVQYIFLYLYSVWKGAILYDKQKNCHSTSSYACVHVCQPFAHCARDLVYMLIDIMSCTTSYFWSVLLREEPTSPSRVIVYHLSRNLTPHTATSQQVDVEVESDLEVTTEPTTKRQETASKV